MTALAAPGVLGVKSSRSISEGSDASMLKRRYIDGTERPLTPLSVCDHSWSLKEQQNLAQLPPVSTVQLEGSHRRALPSKCHAC